MRSFLFLLLIPIGLRAQNILPLKDAIQLALQNNFDVEIQKMNARIAAESVYKGNAGLVPVIDWNVNAGGNLNQVNLTFFDGTNISRLGRSINPNTNLTMNWTLYRGGSLKNRYNLLQGQSELSNIQVKAIEDLITHNVTVAYVGLARQKATLDYLNTTIVYYKERLNITEQRWSIGRGSKLDFLQSQNDYNAQLSQLESAGLVYKNQKILFNILLNRDASLDFDVESLAPNATIYKESDLLPLMEKNNEELIAINKSIDLARLSVKVLEGNLLPEINLNSTLGFTYSQTNAGQVLNNKNYGMGALITARWNLFDGQHNKKQVSIAKLQASVLEKRKEQTTARIRSEVFIALNAFDNTKKILALEENNKKVAEESLNISLEKFRLGSSTIIELNEAQQRFDTAANRYINAFFDLKNAEAEIQRLIR